MGTLKALRQRRKKTLVIRGYSWAGTPTDDFDSATHFFGEVLGLPVLMHDKGRRITVFQLPSGQLFEVFGPGNAWHELMKAPAIAFDVEDISQARAELEAKGVEFVTEIEGTPPGDRWCYFLGPDGFLYEIWQRAGADE